MASVYACEAELRAAVRGWVCEPTQVDDVVQETFAEALRGRHTYDPEQRMMPWLRTIARHIAIRRSLEDDKVEKVELEAIGDLRATVDIDVGSDEHVRQLVLREALGVAMAELSEVQRQALVDSVLDPRSVEERARHAQITAGALRQREKRAKVTVRESILAMAGEPSSWVLVPVVGPVLGRIRDRWARFAAGGWPDAVATYAVPVVVAGAVMVSSIWAPPASAPRPPDDPAPQLDGVPAASAPSATSAPEPAAAAAPAVDAGAPKNAPGPPPVAPPVEAAAEPRREEGVATRLETVHPVGEKEAYFGVEVDCDAGEVGRLACAITPD